MIVGVRLERSLALSLPSLLALLLRLYGLGARENT